MATIIVCVNRRFTPGKPSCAARGSEALADALERAVKRRGLDVSVTRLMCLGRCHEGPNARVAPGGRFFRGVTAEDIPEIINTALDAS